jgi:hypothetical protein
VVEDANPQNRESSRPEKDTEIPELFSIKGAAGCVKVSRLMKLGRTGRNASLAGQSPIIYPDTFSIPFWQ